MSYFNEHSGYHKCCDCRLGQNEDLNLKRLKNTNNELKELIRKIDDLTDCIVETKKTKCFCQPINYSDSCESLNSFECDACRNARQNYECMLCQDCDQMLKVNREIKPILKRDHNIYPLEYYPHGTQRHCNQCQQCTSSRERSRSRNSSRSRSHRSTSPMRSKSTEVKPIWNGVYLRNLCYNKLKKN